jgi:hypothetical protein
MFLMCAMASVLTVAARGSMHHDVEIVILSLPSALTSLLVGLFFLSWFDLWTSALLALGKWFKALANLIVAIANFINVTGDGLRDDINQ